MTSAELLARLAQRPQLPGLSTYGELLAARAKRAEFDRALLLDAVECYEEAFRTEGFATFRAIGDALRTIVTELRSNP